MYDFDLIRSNNIAAFFALTDYSDDTFDLDPPLNELNTRAKNFISAMQYVFSNVSNGMESEDIMFHFYEAGKAAYGKSELRVFFRDIYLILQGFPDGVRVGQLAAVWGVDEFKKRMFERMQLAPFLTIG